MEYPRLVYRSASHHLLVQNDEQYADAMADGWYGSVPEAQSQKHNDAPAGGEAREELEKQARELGIEFDGRTSDRKLAEKINKALE